jgi:hypothetical protein
VEHFFHDGLALHGERDGRWNADEKASAQVNGALDCGERSAGRFSERTANGIIKLPFWTSANRTAMKIHRHPAVDGCAYWFHACDAA